jgi:DNA-binding NtrC family response regulator
MLQEMGTGDRLLAVDDSADAAELVARVASKCGYETRVTSDPKSVRALLTSWNPTIVTLDLCMPDADGIELLSVLAETGFSGRVVIISGQDGWLRKAASRIAETRGLNVADHLQKPFDVTALRRLLIRLRQGPSPIRLDQVVHRGKQEQPSRPVAGPIA